MRDDDLPLFAWKPPVAIIAFPLDRRVGKIRDVARKLLNKSTDHHADYYTSQVTEALRRHLEKLGLSEEQQDEQIGAFWAKVDVEFARLSYRGTGNNPKGAA